MGATLRFLGNVVIAGVWLFAFNALGWVTLQNDTMDIWVLVLVVALITRAAEFIVDTIYVLFVMVTCGIGCFILPFIMIAQGWIWLYLTAKLTGWFTINEPFFWIGLLMSIAYGLVRIPSAKVNYTSASSS